MAPTEISKNKEIRKYKTKKSHKQINEFSREVIRIINILNNNNVEHFFTKDIIDSKIAFEKFIKHFEVEQIRYEILYDFYFGNLPIYNVPLSNDHIDERIGVNFANTLVNDLNGYLMGGISISYDNNKDINDHIKKYMEKIKFIDKIKKLCAQSSVYGKAYVLFYWDAKNNIPNFIVTNPKHLLLVKDDVVGEENILAIYRGYTRIIKGDTIETVPINYIYTQDNKYENVVGSQEYKFIINNNFKNLGVLELKENDLLQSTFEPCISLMTGIDKKLSESASDYSYFSDSYLVFSGEDMPDDQVYNFRREKIINLSKADSEASFLTKPDTYTTKRLYINDLKDLVYDTANLINLSDTNFGDKSGIGTKYRLIRMNGTVKQKTTKLKSIIKDIFDIYFSHRRIKKDEKLKDFNVDNLTIDIKNNLPNNLVENADVISKIGPYLPRKAVYTVLNIDDDPEGMAEAKIKEEKEMADRDIRETFEGISNINNNNKKNENHYDENGNLEEKH